MGTTMAMMDLPDAALWMRLRRRRGWEKRVSVLSLKWCGTVAYLESSTILNVGNMERSNGQAETVDCSGSGPV